MPGYDLDAAAVLLCESDGTPEEVEEEIARMSAVLRAARATRIQVSTSEAERAALLGRTQERLSGRRPRRAGVLLHGRHDSAQASGCNAEGHPGDGTQVRTARVPTSFMPATATCIR